MEYRESSVFKSNDYGVEMTADGSPTLRPQQKESMHHMGGAAGESVYIYYHALDQYAQFTNGRAGTFDWKVLSFGFGMGYNEILAVMYFLKNKGSVANLRLFSHEKDLFLYQLFNDWLSDSGPAKSVFDDVFVGINHSLGSFSPVISIEDLKTAMVWLLKNEKWIQSGPVATVQDFGDIYDVVFFDAFSSKINDYLWTDDFLNSFFRTRLASEFVFSTYACTSILKRVAASHHAAFIKREGYKGKRHASLIYRN